MSRLIAEARPVASLEAIELKLCSYLRLCEAMFLAVAYPIRRPSSRLISTLANQRGRNYRRNQRPGMPRRDSGFRSR